MDFETACQNAFQNISELKTLNYPVYKIEREHNFNQILEKVESLQETRYPLRKGVSEKHNFNEIEEKVKSMKNLVGPVFNIERRNHAFVELEKGLETVKQLSYPVYSIDREHKFTIIQKNL